MPNVLFGRANFELATNYLYEWFGLGIAEAERLGYRVIDLPGDAFTLENLLDALENYSFSAVFLGGHGNDTTLTAQNYEEVLKACVNDQILSGNIAYLCSCFTGKELGPSMVGKDVIAYIGYNRDFRFMIDTNYPILEDPLAEPFKDIVLEVMSRILKGQRIDVVWEGTVAKCNDWIRILSSRPEYEWSQVIGFLKHNRDALISLGEVERAVVSPVTLAPLGITVGSITLGSLLMLLR